MRSRGVVAGSIAAVLAAAAMALLVVGSPGATEQVRQVPGAPTNVGQAAPSTSTAVKSFEAPPTTQFHSEQLPVTVTPSTGLVDQQTVTVHISGFPPNDQVAAVECTSDALTQGINACAIGQNEVSFQTGADGSAQTTFKVSRLLESGGSPVDCDQSPNRCLIGVGAFNDYSVSGGQAISFKPGLPPIPKPNAIALVTYGLHDRQGIELLMTGLKPAQPVQIMECSGNAGANTAVGGGPGIIESFGPDGACMSLAYQWSVPDGGVLQMEVPVSATINGGYFFEPSCVSPGPCPFEPQPIKCAGGSGAPQCSIVIEQGLPSLPSDPVPLHFAS